MTKKEAQRRNWASISNDLIRQLHRMPARNRGKVRRYAFVAGNIAGLMMAAGILLGNLDQPHILQLGCTALVLVGGAYGAVVAPANLIFASSRNWIAWAMFPAALCGAWLIIGTVIETWQLATHMATVPERFMTRFQPEWTTALVVSVVLGALRWIVDGIYDGWSPEMKNPNSGTRSKSSDSLHLAFKSEMRFGSGPSNRAKILLHTREA